MDTKMRSATGPDTFTAAFPIDWLEARYGKRELADILLRMACEAHGLTPAPGRRAEPPTALYDTLRRELREWEDRHHPVLFISTTSTDGSINLSGHLQNIPWSPAAIDFAIRQGYLAKKEDEK